MKDSFWDRRIVPALVFSAMMVIALFGALFSGR